MDGSVLNLDLVSGSNTTVKQLESQILKVSDCGCQVMQISFPKARSYTQAEFLRTMSTLLWSCRFKYLELPDEFTNIFSFWICSKNLSTSSQVLSPSACQLKTNFWIFDYRTTIEE
jgi:hypothetical protein